jgi:DNA recombination protein RmuC
MFLVLIILMLILIVLQFVLRPKADGSLPLLQEKLSRMEGASSRLEQLVREELRISREEAAGSLRDNREELLNTLRASSGEQKLKFDELRKEQADLTTKTYEQLEKIQLKVETKLAELNQQGKADSQQGRESIEKAFDGFRQSFNEAMGAFKDLQREKFGQLEEKQNALIKQTEEKLEKMRETVDEKLTKTLNERLGQSFEQVSKHLESVQQGLGEMKTLATDVGGLKKVLSNVKLRGGMGEVQLAMLLEQILSPAQYDVNVKTRAGSNEPVEFAIKLPGRSEDEGTFVYLPIDAKFPKDVYESLLHAYELGNPEEVEAASKQLEQTMKKMAKDIRDKYIDPPHTTDFALLFLPFEGIYAEVVRRSALIDQLQREYNVAVAGPSTLTAYLNSLQMGFRTLALQKRSSEVWQILGAVKSEFEKFGGMLEKAQKNIHAASDTVDDLLGKRTRAITRKLKQVESLPAAEAQQLLPDLGAAEEGEED